MDFSDNSDISNGTGSPSLDDCSGSNVPDEADDVGIAEILENILHQQQETKKVCSNIQELEDYFSLHTNIIYLNCGCFFYVS